MNIVVLGASGKVGREVVKQAIESGHTVTAFVRDATKVDLPGATVVIGDARTEGDLAQAVGGADAVVSALGTNSSSDLIEASSRRLVRAMASAGVRRLVMMSSFAASPNFQPTGLMKLVNRLALKGMVADRHVGEALVKGSDLDWTLVYASRLKDGPRAGYKLLPGKVPMTASITRADVAAALVAAVDDPSAVRQVRNVAGN